MQALLVGLEAAMITCHCHMTLGHAHDFTKNNLYFTFEIGLSIKHSDNKSIIVNHVKELQTRMTG